MDDDPVLRSLAEDLERDDPRLAALLGGLAPHRHHRVAWFLAALPLLGFALLLPPGMVFGLVAVLAIVTSPLAACWLVGSGDGP
ncbi:MAG: hypothetical protein JWR45_885 [Blastococcus sp.]|jgi:hypothetical protein|nr:hypothetical protein [Blastococcus sp.]